MDIFSLVCLFCYSKNLAKTHLYFLWDRYTYLLHQKLIRPRNLIAEKQGKYSLNYFFLLFCLVGLFWLYPWSLFPQFFSQPSLFHDLKKEAKLSPGCPCRITGKISPTWVSKLFQTPGVQLSKEQDSSLHVVPFLSFGSLFCYYSILQNILMFSYSVVTSAFVCLGSSYPACSQR